jgi:F-type H+-transporting ATPase subunit b
MQQVLEALGIKGPVILLQIIGFLVLYFLLRRFLFGPVGAMLKAREQEVANGLQAAEAARQEAERLKVDKDQIIAEARDEGRGLVQKAVKEAQTARERILAEAQQEKEALLERGRAILEVERNSAVAELRGQVSDLALRAAEKAIRQATDDAAHRQAIDAFITSLEKS